MDSNNELFVSIKASPEGITLAELLMQHPNIARRTAQRQIAKFINEGLLIAHGEGRARRYFGVDASLKTAIQTNNKDAFPAFISVSADSQDILNYINLPIEARRPVKLVTHLNNLFL